MRGSELLDKLTLIDPAYIEAADRAPTANARPWLRWGSMAACLVLALTAVAILPSRIARPNPPDTTIAPPPITDSLPPSDTTIAPPIPPDTTTAPPERTREEIDAIIGRPMGGGSTFFDREYLDETYNLAYLRPLGEDVSLLDYSRLDLWVEEVFLKQSQAEQNALPTLYQAVRDLGIARDDLLRVNANRRAKGDSMVLDDAVIEALYLPEDEMRRALIHPLALWHDGEIYTWNTLRNSATAAAIPTDVLDQYITRVIETCLTQGWLTEAEVQRMMGETK